MNIKQSLKVYIVLVSAMLGLVLAIAAGSYSTYNLFTGMNLVTKGVMMVQAETVQPTPGNPINNKPFIISARWQDLPKHFQSVFDDTQIKSQTLYTKTLIQKHPQRANDRYIYFLLKHDKSSEPRFVALKIRESDFQDFAGTLDINLFPQINYIIAFVSLSLGVFLLGVFLILRRITHPIECLRQWTETIGSNNELDNVPDFKFSELNAMAELIASSVKSVRSSIQKEQEFIRYASHELRTPIAVIHSNAELMRKILDADLPKEKLYKQLQRIETNSFAMADLCRSLLWLNNENANQIKESMTSLRDLTNISIEEHRYLLKGKSVEIELETDDYECLNLSVMCKIVIANLIRNAFQHTIEGKIRIKQQGMVITVTNEDINPDLNHVTTGFGLGLTIIQKICEKYFWPYEERVMANGRSITVTFA